MSVESRYIALEAAKLLFALGEEKREKYKTGNDGREREREIADTEKELLPSAVKSADA